MARRLPAAVEPIGIAKRLGCALLLTKAGVKDPWVRLAKALLKTRMPPALLLLALAGCGGGDWPEQGADTMPVQCIDNPKACT